MTETTNTAAQNELPCGVIRSLNISKRKGTRKKPVEDGIVTLQENWGVVQDAHAGDWHRQVSILAWESIVTAQSWGLDVKEGDFAENITSEGLNLLELPLGTQVQIGDTLMELSQIGKVCHTRCAIYFLAGDCIFPREGIFFVVLKGGTIKVGDAIQVVKMGDGTCQHTPPEALAEIEEWNAKEAERLAAEANGEAGEPQPASDDEVCDTARIAQRVLDLEKKLGEKDV